MVLMLSMSLTKDESGVTLAQDSRTEELTDRESDVADLPCFLPFLLDFLFLWLLLCLLSLLEEELLELYRFDFERFLLECIFPDGTCIGKLCLPDFLSSEEIDSGRFTGFMSVVPVLSECTGYFDLVLGMAR